MGVFQNRAIKTKLVIYFLHFSLFKNNPFLRMLSMLRSSFFFCAFLFFPKRDSFWANFGSSSLKNSFLTAQRCSDRHVPILVISTLVVRPKATGRWWTGSPSKLPAQSVARLMEDVESRGTPWNPRCGYESHHKDHVNHAHENCSGKIRQRTECSLLVDLP